MGKNHAEEVAKLLGVEIDEEFNLSPKDWTGDCVFKISNKGLEVRNTDCNKWDRIHTMICDLLFGKYEIIKKPWKPKFNDKFYFISKIGAVETTYFGNIFSIAAYKIGNCYRTDEEITPEIIQKWKDFYASDEVIDVFLKEGN